MIPPPNTRLLPPERAVLPLPVPGRSFSAASRPHFQSSQSIPTHSRQQRAMHPVLGVQPSHPPDSFDPQTQQPATTFFPDANNFNIGHQNIHVGPNIQQAGASKTVFELLEPYVSHGASYNSAERCDAPKCSPETRKAIQEELVGLVRDGDVYEPLKRMTWLGGPAGAGKTAIAGSVAVTCTELGLLAGSFFFSSVQGSGDTRRTKRCVITTLAYQLARHKVLHEYKVQLIVAIEENSDIFHKSLHEQAQCLILGPLRAIHGKCETSGWPRGIIYDGLDEVSAVQYHDGKREDLIRKDDDDQLEILQVLHTLTNSPVFPFRIFIASRPESIITQFFKSTALASTALLFLDSTYNPGADINHFLRSKFAVIRDESGMSNPSWPGEEVIDQLVEMSSGQFIVPSTILRYINSGHPQRQLNDIMQVARGQVGSKNPFALLDAVYTHIINRSPDPALVVNWIHCIAFGEKANISGMPGREGSRHSMAMTANFWKAFLEDMDGEFYYLLAPLASLLSIPPHDRWCLPITMYHKSFTDFLTSPVRCGDLYVEKEASYQFAARRYVCILQKHGPGPLPLSYTLGEFLRDWLMLNLFPFPKQKVLLRDQDVRFPFSGFLGHLHGGSTEDLATCDVAWWTSLVLQGSIGTRLDSSVFSPTLAASMLGGIYFTIHSAVCGPRGSVNACHKACSRWRKGILDEAGAHGWCIHWLEKVPLEQLRTFECWKFEGMFGKDGGRRKCAMCQRRSHMEWITELSHGQIATSHSVVSITEETGKKDHYPTCEDGDLPTPPRPLPPPRQTMSRPLQSPTRIEQGYRARSLNRNHNHPTA
ncbi:hypothetical protein NMY22_g10318 [Coprinellus aureogranulatus]|nr:hypothetical protein NMY22_g10318 [Coprinellus aureogranulatus]